MKDLRELMEWLEARGEVVHVSREVDPDYELVAVAKKVNEATGKAVYFEHVKGSKFPVLSYALADRDGIANAFDPSALYRAIHSSIVDMTTDNFAAADLSPISPRRYASTI